MSSGRSFFADLWGITLLALSFLVAAPVLLLECRHYFGGIFGLDYLAILVEIYFGWWARIPVLVVSTATLIFALRFRAKLLLFRTCIALMILSFAQTRWTMALHEQRQRSAANAEKLRKARASCDDLKKIAPWVLLYTREEKSNLLPLTGEIPVSFWTYCQGNAHCPSNLEKFLQTGTASKVGGTAVFYAINKQQPFSEGLWRYGGFRSLEALRDEEPKFGKGPDFLYGVTLTSDPVPGEVACRATESSLPASFFTDRKMDSPNIINLGIIENPTLAELFPEHTFSRIMHRYHVGNSSVIYSQFGTLVDIANEHILIWSDTQAADFLNTHRKPQTNWMEIKKTVEVYAALAGYSTLSQSNKFISDLKSRGIYSFPYTESWKVLPLELRESLFVPGASSERLMKAVKWKEREHGITLDITFLTYASLECYSRDRLFITKEGGFVIEDTAFLFCVYPPD